MRPASGFLPVLRGGFKDQNMLATKNYTLSLERDYDFRACRWLDSEKHQVIAAILTFRRKGLKPKLAWVFRIVGRHGHPIISAAWRSDSRDYSRQFRGIRTGVFGFEMTRSANGPYISR